MRSGTPKRSWLVACIAGAVLAGCSDGPTGPSQPTSLSIDTKEQFVVAGDTLRIAITTVGGSSSAVEWESLNPQVATVQGGLVTGVARGNARIVARAGSLADTATVGVLRSTFNVSAADFCANPQWAPVRIAAVGTRSIILADTRIPVGVYTDSDYRSFASQFDNAIYPTVTDAFGEPLDVDANGRFIVLFTRAVNELTDDPTKRFTAGFVWARDLFPRTPRVLLGLSFPDNCPGSNEAEMTYMAIPDPAWPENIRNFIRRTTVSTIAHEFQHAINASRRIFVYNTLPEEVWLNEALSHITEELMYYRASGLAPGQAIDRATLTSSPQRLDAVNGFQVVNLANFGTYLQAPEAGSPLARDDSVTGATRGSAWNLLRYSADRRGGDQTQLWYGLLNTDLAGTANLQQAVGSDILPWMRDWAVSLYASRGTPHAESRFRQASWNFASVLPALFDEFPLSLQPLANEVPVSTTVRAGSAAYLRFAVASGQVAEIDVRVTGEPSVESCRDTGVTTSLGVEAVYTGPAGSGESLCFTGAASGSEFAVIPFHASLTPGANLIVDVIGSGIEAVPAAATSRTSFGHALGFDHTSLIERAATMSRTDALHLRLLEQEREEVARRIPSLSLASLSADVQATTAGPLMVSVVRIR
jgi:hypothetical protein